MKILKLKLYQETACYKKPFAFKVAETYPLPPYSTVIGMLHKILGAKQGEYFPMNLSIQGNYKGLFNNYCRYRKFLNDIEKKEYDNANAITKCFYQMILNDINLIIHIKSEDEIIDKIYQNIIKGKETFTLGRNEDLVRLDEIKFVNYKLENERSVVIPFSAYMKPENSNFGTSYRLAKNYKIKNEIRVFDKVNVKYVEHDTEILCCEKDEYGDLVHFVD